MPDLWRHQREAVEFLRAKPAGMLALEMGCGKTLCALELLQLWQAKRVLVLCPKSVVPVWPAEVEKHYPGVWRVVAPRKGSVRDKARLIERAQQLTAQTGERLFVVLNYEATIREPMTTLLRRGPWDVLILDESHRIKSAAGITSRLASQFADRIPHRLALTGTPMPHSPLDIYAQYRALDKSIYGASHVAFKARYAVMEPLKLRDGRAVQTVVGYRDLDDLHERMYRIAYRCRAEDVLDLPEWLDVTRTCELSPAAAKAYRSMEEDLRVQIAEGEVTAGNALAKLIRLQQIANGYLPIEGQPALLDTAKADLLEDLLEDLQPPGTDEPAEAVVVFCRFHHDLDVVHERGQRTKHVVAELSGRVNDLSMWQDGEANVLAVQIQAGGLGVDLSRARYAVYYSLDWSLGNYEQSRARVHRPGQTRAVTYIHLLAEGTVDEKIMEALAAKADVVRYVVDSIGKPKEAEPCPSE